MKIIAGIISTIKREIEIYRRFCQLSRAQIEALRNGPGPTASVRPVTRSILINRPGGRVDVVGVAA